MIPLRLFFSMMLICFLFCFVLFMPIGLSGLEPSKKISQYVHYTWDTRDNLPQATIWGLTQTRDGYLWLGTEEGLVRFDGVKFTVYNTRNIAEITANWMVGICEDNSGNLWVATWGGGLLRHNRKTGVFKSYTREDGLSHINLIDVCEGPKGKIWVSAANGLNVLDPQTGQFSVYQKKDGLPHNHVNRVFFDPSGGVWIGTENGLSRMKDGTFSNYDTTQGLAGTVVWSFCRDREGTVWVGTDKGISYLKDGNLSKPFKVYKNGDPVWKYLVWRIIQDKDGNIWAATDKGLGRISRDESGSFTDDRALEGKTILSVIEDTEGNI